MTNIAAERFALVALTLFSLQACGELTSGGAGEVEVYTTADDPQVAAAWSALLQAWGIDARFASCASEAWDLVDGGFRPQAILCDQRLRSGESGFDILRALMAHCPDAYGAMVSGELHSPALQEAENEGYLVLPKPLDVVRLHAVLTQWLEPRYSH